MAAREPQIILKTDQRTIRPRDTAGWKIRCQIKWPGTRTEFSSRATSLRSPSQRPLGADLHTGEAAGAEAGAALLPGRLSCAATVMG